MTPNISFSHFSWRQSKLGNLAEIGSSVRVHESDWTSQGIPFIRARDIVASNNQALQPEIYISEEIFNELSKRSRVLKGDVLVTGVGTVGVPYLVKEDDKFYYKDGNIIYIRSNGGLHPEFLYHYIHSYNFKKYLRSISGCGTVATYTIKNAIDTPIFFPSIEEQQKIAAFFTALDEKIQNTCKKLVLTLKMKRALVRDILTREVGYSSSSDWQDVTLGDVSSIVKTRKSSDFLLYVGTEDLIKDFGGLNKVKKEDVSGIHFEKDDILISNIRPYLKKLWMSDEEGIASTDVIVYRSKNIEPSLLKHILSTDSFFEHVAQGYKGSKMPRGDKSQMATFAFQIPSDEKEQKQIANFINLIDKKITCLREQEKALKKQKQAFMQQMFV